MFEPVWIGIAQFPPKWEEGEGGGGWVHAPYADHAIPFPLRPKHGPILVTDPPLVTHFVSHHRARAAQLLTPPPTKPPRPPPYLHRRRRRSPVEVVSVEGRVVFRKKTKKPQTVPKSSEWVPIWRSLPCSGYTPHHKDHQNKEERERERRWRRRRSCSGSGCGWLVPSHWGWSLCTSPETSTSLLAPKSPPLSPASAAVRYSEFHTLHQFFPHWIPNRFDLKFCFRSCWGLLAEAVIDVALCRINVPWFSFVVDTSRSSNSYQVLSIVLHRHFFSSFVAWFELSDELEILVVGVGGAELKDNLIVFYAGNFLCLLLGFGVQPVVYLCPNPC